MTTKQTASALADALSTVIRGKTDRVGLFVATFLAGGHALVEDVPGLGKTTLAKSLARLVSSGPTGKAAAFNRIQCTPDLLPYDITGVDVFDPKKNSFSFRKGPVFTDILLADEINRTTAKVQSALLEVMQERQVTSGGKTHPVSDLFFVVATQNPVETDGTYPLPAAQLDRFMIRLSLGYPDSQNELAILRDDPSERILPTLRPVVSAADILASRKEQREVFCHPALSEAIVSIARETRVHSAFRLGVSPRGCLHLLHASRALALSRGRDWVEDIDLADLALPAFAHRVIPADARTDVEVILSGIVSTVLKRTASGTDWSKGPAPSVPKKKA